jgi:hypothetical protein
MVSPLDPSSQLGVGNVLRLIELEVQTTVLTFDPYKSSPGQHKNLLLPVLLG